MRVCSRGRNIWDGRLESWTHIGNVGEELGLIDIELDPIETRRIVAGILNNLSDVDASMTPFDAGLGDFVDLDGDDDFFGQDALGMADRRTRRFRAGLHLRRAVDRRGRHPRRRRLRSLHRRIP